MGFVIQNDPSRPINGDHRYPRVSDCLLRVVVVVTTTIRAHGLSGLVKFWKGLCNWQCSQRCYSQSCGWNGGMSNGYKGNSL